MNLPLREIYDGFAETYEQNRGLFDMTEILDDFYSRLSVKPGRVLDMGCGSGEPFGRFFVDRKWEVTGVDFSARMLELAAEFVPGMQTIHADMGKVVFEDETFDAIVSVFSLFHVPRTEHPALFQRFRRWLRPGGKALFTYATKEYTGHDEFDGTLEFMGRQLYYSHTTPEKLTLQLDKAGLTVEEARYRTIADETFLWITVGANPGSAVSTRPGTGRECPDPAES